MELQTLGVTKTYYTRGNPRPVWGHPWRSFLWWRVQLSSKTAWSSSDEYIAIHATQGSREEQRRISRS